MAKVMTINSGSSSLKFKLYEMPEEVEICSGNCEQIGLNKGIFTIKYDGKKEVSNPVFPTHSEAAKKVIDTLVEKGIIKSFDEIKAAGNDELLPSYTRKTCFPERTSSSEVVIIPSRYTFSRRRRMARYESSQTSLLRLSR